MKTYRDIVGDGGSDILGQVRAQRAAIDRSLAGVRRMVAIGSGKGGVGKSTLTLMLAATLHRQGHRVAVLDADLNGPSQARMAGLGSVPLVPGESGLRLPRTAEGLGVLSLGSAVPESESLEFQTVARGDSHVWRATREFALLADLLAGVEWGEQDFLMVDLPPGAERTFQYAEFLGPRVDFVLVTLPSALARGVVARSIAALRPTPNRLLGYVENMSGYYCSGCETVKPLFPVTSGPGASAVELEAPCLGHVPFDPEVAAGCDRGEGVLDAITEPVRQALQQLAGSLVATDRRAEEAST